MSCPFLPRITIDAPDLARERGELIVAPEGRAGLRTARMPLFPDALHDDVHVPLLDLADVATGERAVSTGRGAAHELRLLFEGVTWDRRGGAGGPWRADCLDGRRAARSVLPGRREGSAVG